MLARVARELPSEARVFYRDTWAIIDTSEAGKPKLRVSLFRFGFFKGLVGTLDERAAKEMYAAEMLVRHAANICYALFFAVVTLCAAARQPLAVAYGLKPLLYSIAGIEGIVLFVILLPNLG